MLTRKHVWFFPSINHLCNECLFCTHHVPGTVLDLQGTVVSRTREDPAVLESVGREGERPQSKKQKQMTANCECCQIKLQWAIESEGLSKERPSAERSDKCYLKDQQRRKGGGSLGKRSGQLRIRAKSVPAFLCRRIQSVAECLSTPLPICYKLIKSYVKLLIPNA